MSTKKILIEVDVDELKQDEELRSTLIRLGGRKALDDAFDEAEGYDFTESEIENMSDETYSKNRKSIKKAQAAGRVKSD